MSWDGVIGIICTILGAVLAYVAFSRNQRNDSQDAGELKGSMMTELGYIKANTEEIKAEQKEQRKINNDITIRLGKVENAAQRAHYRIDRLEKETPHD